MCALCLVQCSASEQIERAPIALRELDGCRLAGAETIELSALGDFPSRRVQLQPGSTSSAFDQFPLDTRELEVNVDDGSETARGLGLLTPSADPQPLLVLPLARSCPLGDPFARALEGSSAVALPGGGLLIVGGRDSDGEVQSTAVTLAPNATLVEPIANGMLLRRMNASATSVGKLVVIAGGTGDPAGEAHYTYEVFDRDAGNFAGSLSGQLLTGPRMDHAALALPDGRVLLVGGEAAPQGPPLTAAELIDPLSGVREVIDADAAPKVARIAPILLALDSGSIVLLAGEAADGTRVTSVERFDPMLKQFSSLPIELPNDPAASAVALPGGRVAFVGCDVAAMRCELALLIDDAAEFLREDVALDFSTVAPNGLSDLQLVALDAGRLLLTASDPADADVRRRAFAIDLNVPAITQLDASRVPSALVLLETGDVAELDALGTSLREFESLSRYESPDGNLITQSLALIDLDAPSHWSHDANGLRSLVLGSQLSIPKLRFQALQLELAIDGGDASLSFTTDAGERFGVEWIDGRVLTQACQATLSFDDRLIAQIEPQRLVLQDGAGHVLCEVARPAGAVRIDLRASEGTLIRELTIARR
ncbi:MAG TPA: hypothetical protein VGI70_08235 [Polyangiales bacterium]